MPQPAGVGTPLAPAAPRTRDPLKPAPGTVEVVEDVSIAGIIAAFVVSTVGFSFFVFGKKQQRVPQLVVGMLMMASPLVVHDPVWVTITAAVLLLGLHVALRRAS